MYVFGEIDNSSTIIESNVVNYTQNLTTSSIGIKSIKIVSGSISESYWNSLNVLFYTSGSPQYLNEHKFGTPSSNISVKKKTGKQFLTKYHGYPSSSIIPIPSQYYGEKITEKSFKLTEVDVTDNSNNNPIIIDDGKGNLYSTNAHHSQSAGALSSSDNYVGNIFYDKGLVVITETGSWSGSVNYSDLGTNYSLKFDSFNSITTYEYSLNLLFDTNPDYLSLEIHDSRLTNPDYYHLQPLSPPDENISIQGEINVEIDAPFCFGNGSSETLTYSLRIQDNKKSWSNTITTPMITVNK